MSSPMWTKDFVVVVYYGYLLYVKDPSNKSIVSHWRFKIYDGCNLFIRNRLNRSTICGN